MSDHAHRPAANNMAAAGELDFFQVVLCTQCIANILCRSLKFTARNSVSNTAIHFNRRGAGFCEPPPPESAHAPYMGAALLHSVVEGRE
jgi:hypothetical protein